MTPPELLAALEGLRDYLNTSGHAHLDALKRAVEATSLPPVLDVSAPLPSPAVAVKPEPFRPLNAPKKRSRRK